MSTAHHGDGRRDDRNDLDNMLRRFVQQAEGTAKRAYPEGRMGAHDEGELVFMVGPDPKTGNVMLQFNKPVTWIGMKPADAVRLAELLIKQAKSVSKEPLTVNMG